jgi:hypothetical protein
MRFQCIYMPAKAEGAPPTPEIEIRQLYEQLAK